jgi:hypothetical protein
MTRTTLLLSTIAVSVLLLGTTGAAAKDFGPGDLSVCNSARCVKIVRPGAVALLGPFYYSGGKLDRAMPPGLGAPSFELRFSNGYATGIVGSRKLDRFLSYGVHLERFERGVWYEVPPALARELRRLTARLRPIAITSASLSRSR